MNPRIIIATSLISILLLTSCDSELLPQALAFKTQDTVADVKTESTDVFEEIQRNIDLVTELKTNVQASQLSNKPVSLNSIIKDIEKITASYEKLSGQRDNIRSEILGKVKLLEEMRETVDSEIKTLWDRKTVYSNQLQLINDHNPEISKTRKEALTRAISYVDDQIELWREFSNIQKDIIMEMGEIQQTIDSFLGMIESTSIVFREGLNLLSLQRDINEAINLFANDIPKMERLTQDMRSSWDTLDYLVSTLTGISKISIN